MTRIGIVCEGIPGNEDEKVLKHLASRIVPSATIECAPLGKKPDLIRNSGSTVKAFLDSGFSRVVVVWDLEPGFGREVCLKEDRREIFASLAAAGVLDTACVFLVAIHKELESWLLADGKALSAVLSTRIRPARIRDMNNPEHEGNPKGRLRKLFEIRGRSYTAMENGIQIAEQVPNNFGGLKNCPSFKRFGKKLTDPCPPV